MEEHIKIDEIKKFLEEKIQELKKEKEILELILGLLESGVVSPRGTIKIEPKPGEKIVPLRSSDGTLLAEMYIGKDEMRIIPFVELSVDIPPFRQFFIARVLEGIKKKDIDRIERGELDTSKAFDYEIIVDRGIIKEIRLKNIFDERRRMDIKSSAKWTLEKMLEKTRRKKPSPRSR